MSEVIGSWKIIEMSRPRISRISLVGELEQVAALEQDAPAGDAAGGFGKQPHDGERGDRFAAAGFADEGDDLTGLDLVGNAVDRTHDTARGVEFHAEALDLEQGRGRPCGRCIRGPTRWQLTV